MRVTPLLFLIVGIAGVVIVGCSAIPATQPSLTIPIHLGSESFGTQAPSGDFFSTYVDMASESDWQKLNGRISGIEGVSLTMDVLNASGDATLPSPVKLQYFISDQGDLTPTTVYAAEPLIESSFPGGVPTLKYDSGFVLLSSAAKDILQDGTFYLYAVGNSNTIEIHTTQVLMHVKIHISLL
ncbi:MAG TPA: hypothetical protein VHV83_16580 [Armatimonadota bacterium]|nr:hypothetical protein [Armatimonadota bacterium]